MAFWNRKKQSQYATCTQCRHMFEPEQYISVTFPDLCRTCRKPAQELADRKAVVQRYVDANWETLEEAAKVWAEKSRVSDKSVLAAMQQAWARQYDGSPRKQWAVTEINQF